MATRPEDQSCVTCSFWDHDSPEWAAATGFSCPCRADPPQLTPLSGAAGQWPYTMSYDWCGKHRHRKKLKADPKPVKDIIE